MVVACYHGGNRENSENDYTNWYEWIAAIKEDFRKFIDYKLVSIDNSKNLIKELKKVSNNLLNTCPLGLNYLREFKISIGEFFTIIEYPVFDSKLNRYNCGCAIISRDYKHFIFVDNEDSAPKVSVYEVDGVVHEEKITQGIDLTWNEYSIENNLDILRGKTTSIKELGGFAEEPEDVDGDYEAFNFCMADEYASSMISEDFESLGYMDFSLFESIAHWLNYDGKIGANNLEFISNIPSGNFMTSFGRTFESAVCARRLGEFAQNMVYGGNINPRVYFTAIAYSTCLPNILNHIFESIKEPSEYTLFVNELMNVINQEYLRLDEGERDSFIDQLKKYLRSMVATQNKNFLENKNNYPWFNDVFGIKDKKKILEDS